MNGELLITPAEEYLTKFSVAKGIIAKNTINKKASNDTKRNKNV